jgi:aryl-alcohol dehydrogenase-like predicted oxidoreductase
MSTLAADLGLDGPVELALRFGLSKPGISTVLVGYSTLAHLTDAIRYTERGALAQDALARVLELSAP